MLKQVLGNQSDRTWPLSSRAERTEQCVLNLGCMLISPRELSKHTHAWDSGMGLEQQYYF